MVAIERTGSHRIVIRLEDVEKAALRSLAAQIIQMVQPAQMPDADPLAQLVGIDPDAQRPDDPVLSRLLPDAYADDEEAASEFRRFTERSLREGKVANARSVVSSLEQSGEKVVLSDADVRSWLGLLNDVRLTLGTRLEITDDSHDEFDDLDEDDPRFEGFQIYGWLTFIQDALLQALTNESDET